MSTPTETVVMGLTAGLRSGDFDTAVHKDSEEYVSVEKVIPFADAGMSGHGVLLKALGRIDVRHHGLRADRAATPFGWVGPLGRQAPQGRQGIQGFAKSVKNEMTNTIPSSKDITIRAKGCAVISGGEHSGTRIQALAAGGPVRGGKPNRDSVPALLMPGEFVVDKRGKRLSDALHHFGAPALQPVG